MVVDGTRWKDVRCEGWGRLDPPVETVGYKILNGLERTKNKKATIKRYRPIMAFFKM